MFAILVLVPIQVYADTLFEFAVKDAPNEYINRSLTVEDYDSGEVYEWLIIDDKEYLSLPHTTNAMHNPEYLELDSSEHYTFESDMTAFRAIAKTIPIGTPLLMCISYDNVTRCENEAVNRNNYAMVEVDMDAGKMVRTGSSQ